MTSPFITNSELIKRLEEAARKPFREYTKYEAQEQRVSFIYGQLPKNSKLTKADIRTILNLSEPDN